MADDKKNVPEKTTVDKVADWAKIWLIRIVKTVLVLLIIVKGLPWIIEKADIDISFGQKYAASYDFSKISGQADSKEFNIPAGDKSVLVALPVNYRVTFSSATASAGELDRLDGSKPIPFGEQTDFGKLRNLPLAVAIKVPEGCTMVVSFVHH